MKYVLPTWWAALLVVVGLLLLPGCEKDNAEPEPPDLGFRTPDFAPDVALAWNELLLEVERTSSGYRPPVSARAMAYISLAAYEAGRPGMAGASSMVSHLAGLQLPQPQPNLHYYWPAAVHEAYATIIRRFFPTPDQSADASRYVLEYEMEQVFERALASDPATYERSLDFGRAIAEAVYAWSATDRVGHNAYLRNHDASYLPNPNATAGHWVPTPPVFTPALLPYWGSARTFAIDEATLLGVPPPAYGDTVGNQWYDEAREVYETTRSLSVEQQWIAEFWSDDVAGLTFTPAARWLAIANQVVKAEKPNLARALRVYAQLSMGLADAGVACWYNKYLFNVERPVTYIQREIDPTWQEPTFIRTPPFPAYPSGHSTFGAVAARVLEANFGEQYGMTDRCHEARTEFDGRPRTFGSFRQMAEENAISRIYLGVHFHMDAMEGLRLGYEVGDEVLALPW